jgi:UDP-glucose 4-epimerase
MSKTAIVTGGAGFIGSHVVDLLLKKNFKVFVIDNLSGGRLSNISHHKKNKNFFLIKKDICDSSIQNLNLKKINFIFHFAGKGDIVPSIENPSLYFNTNVNGTLNILELARKLKIKKFIYAASSSCYGLASTPTKEDHPLDPKYPYALSKLMGEQISMHWSKLYKLPIISVRIFNAYGPRVKTTGAYGAVFGVFFKQKLSGKPFTLVGNGKQKRDFLFVTDVANAFYKCAISPKKNEIYNLGAGSPQTILKLINILKGKIIKIPKRPGEPDCTWANIHKIKKEIKWKPKVSFDRGVNLMLKDISKWKDAPLWDPKKIKKATKIWFKYLD